MEVDGEDKENDKNNDSIEKSDDDEEIEDESEDETDHDASMGNLQELQAPGRDGELEQAWNLKRVGSEGLVVVARAYFRPDPKEKSSRSNASTGSNSNNGGSGNGGNGNGSGVINGLAPLRVKVLALAFIANTSVAGDVMSTPASKSTPRLQLVSVDLSFRFNSELCKEDAEGRKRKRVKFAPSVAKSKAQMGTVIVLPFVDTS